MTKILNLILSLIFVALASFFATKALTYSQNNFFNNPHWYTQKQFFVSANHDSIQSLFSRSLLARNVFNVTKNFGHQLIFSKNNYDPKEIFFEFKLGVKGYLDIIYNYDGETFQAVRLSRSDYLASAVYTATKSGEFLSREPFFYFIEDNQDHIARLSELNGKIIVYVDNKEIYRTPSEFKHNKIGFFSSLQDLEIKNAKVVEKNSEMHILEFKNDLSFNKFFYKNFFILLLSLSLAVLVYYFFAITEPSLNFLHFSILLFASFFLWFCFDYYHYSQIPKEFDMHNFSFREPGQNQFSDFEELRFDIFRYWHKVVGGKEPDLTMLQSKGLFRPVPQGIRFCQNSTCDFLSLDGPIPVKPIETTRVFLVGSSFSANYGVTDLKDCFFDQLSSVISTKTKNKKFEFYNFSEPGSKVHSVEERLKQNILNFDADIVILLFLMDHQDPQAIARMSHFLKTRNKKAVVINPSNDAEDAYSYFPLINFNMRQFMPISQLNRLFEGEASIIDDLRFRGDIYFLNANDLVRRSDFYNKGNIWWDSIHMTPFGQRLLAREVGLFIAEKIK